MSWFSKVLKKGAKIVAKALRPTVAAATGGLSEKAITVAKGIGSIAHGRRTNKRAASLKIDPVSVRAVISKQSIPRGVRTVQSAATTMPGGAPLSRSSGRKARRRKTSTPSVPAGPRGASSRTSSKKPKTVKLPKPPKVKSKRKAPTGGLDLKALSASWKAAGKPGTWQEWIKANK